MDGGSASAVTPARPAATPRLAADRLIIVAGPTASGKSALAMALAERCNGVIINADAMQCYAELRILTARPSPEDEALAPHRLYGVRAAADPGNAAWWRDAALAALAEAKAAGNTPILCGGTGMYLAALLHGLADIPDPGPAARAEARQKLAELGAPGLHCLLRQADPETAAKLRPTDSQRIARAYEVWRGTGYGLRHWQSRPTERLTGWTARLLLLDPPREALRQAVATRFAAMLEAGALDELRALLALNLNPALPLMRAHGVPELTPYLNGETSLTEASTRAILATRQYVRRQAIWFRHQKLVENSAMQIITSRNDDPTQFLTSYSGDLANIINHLG